VAKNDGSAHLLLSMVNLRKSECTEEVLEPGLQDNHRMYRNRHNH